MRIFVRTRNTGQDHPNLWGDASLVPVRGLLTEDDEGSSPTAIILCPDRHARQLRWVGIPPGTSCGTLGCREGIGEILSFGLWMRKSVV